MGEAKEKDMAPAGISEARRRTVADREAALNISTYLKIKLLNMNRHDKSDDYFKEWLEKNLLRLISYEHLTTSIIKKWNSKRKEKILLWWWAFVSNKTYPYYSLAQFKFKRLLNLKVRQKFVAQLSLSNQKIWMHNFSRSQNFRGLRDCCKVILWIFSTLSLLIGRKNAKNS